MPFKKLLRFVVVFAGFTACAPEPAVQERTGEGVAVGLASPSVPAWGEPETVDVATWNIEWFGNGGRGPTDEARQLDNVAGIIAGANIDFWALQEVVDVDHFADLMDELPEYDSLVANDPIVVDGRSNYHAGEQKPAFIWRSDVAELVSARVILRSHSHAFAGRPPLEAHMRFVHGGVTSDAWVITFHGKASGGFANWDRRKEGADALARYLREERPGQAVILLGDFNDDLDESLVRSRPSPYGELAAEPTVTAVSMPVAVFNEVTTVRGSIPLDHVLFQPSAGVSYRADTVEVLRPDEFVAAYESTTSDHFPVAFRLDLHGERGGTVLINEVLANEPGSDTSREFVELVNPGSSPIDLSGLVLADRIAQRHLFAEGTTLGAGEVILVSGGFDYGTGSVPASTGSLRLNNSSETLTLYDASGARMDQISWTSSRDGVSLNREQDGEAGAMVEHSTFGSSHSPLRRSDGSRF